MLTKLGIISVGSLLLLTPSQLAHAFLPRDDLTLSLDVVVNPVEGTPLTACAVSETLQAYGKSEWLISIGETRPRSKSESKSDSEGQWEGVGDKVRCEGESLENPRLDSAGADAAPYVIVEVSSVAKVIRQMEDERLVSVKLSLSLRKLSGFAPEHEPVYQESQAVREFFFSESQDAFVPLLVATAAEREALGIGEVYLRVAVGTVGDDSGTAYGVITVTSGFDEAELLLDGGTAGTISAQAATTLRNVRVGRHEVGARDAEGREVRKLVEVRANRTVLVDLRVPGQEDDPNPFRLTSLGSNTEGYEEYRRENDGAVVVKIPSGEFLMGNSETERTPLEHMVYVSDFLMDKRGVTWGQFKQFAEMSGTPLPPHEPYWGIHDDHPMVYVTWGEAKEYCEWTGGRLPTEAEREKAARGTDERKYPWGNEEPDPERAVFRRSWGKEATSAVGTHPTGASPYGLLDMGGNVWEWCSDWYDDDYYAVSPYRDPKGPSAGRGHVVRGGSWDSRPSVLSASCRSWGHQGYRDGDFGFRCAMNAPR
jgi:formylglycine-generating enzyme required for sulfatase activity